MLYAETKIGEATQARWKYTPAPYSPCETLGVSSKTKRIESEISGQAAIQVLGGLGSGQPHLPVSRSGDAHLSASMLAADGGPAGRDSLAREDGGLNQRESSHLGLTKEEQNGRVRREGLSYSRSSRRMM